VIFREAFGVALIWESYINYNRCISYYDFWINVGNHLIV
jgi:hypothetical protein